MVFLTYHRITLSRENDIFSVGRDELRAHFRLLAEKRLNKMTVDDLFLDRGNKSGFLMSFDDGTLDHIQLAAPALEEFGLKGIFFVPTEKIGRLGRLTRQHISQLSERGHEIGCHSREHRRLDTMCDSEIACQLTTSCKILESITGKPPRILAPPGGYTNRRVRAVAAASGLGAIRTMKWGLNRTQQLDDLETIALHRDFTIARLSKILDGHGLWRLRALFLSKQALKKFLPISLYERARSLVFRK